MHPPALRYPSVDAFRGIIMIVMAIDHASAFIAREHGAEFWAGAMTTYHHAFPFLTRWVTHICAPGFFFLMGAGIYWFAAGRRDSGWTDSRIMRRTLWRGLAILAIAQLFEAPLIFAQSLLQPPAVSLSQITAPPPNDGSTLFWGFITLSGLGMVMLVCGLLLRLRPLTWLFVSALCVLATNTLMPESGRPGPWWATLLLIPAISQHIVVVYPVIPWLAGAAAGMYFGHWWRKNPDRAGKRSGLLGALLLLAAVLLRMAGGWGNIRPPRDSGWIEFLNNVKYPPSLVFWSMSLGVGLLILYVLSLLPAKVKSEHSPWIVFGQTPLFFYLTHFYLFFVIGLVLFREAGSLEITYVVWALGVAALYPLCAWYRRFKFSKPPASLWRLL